MTPKGCIGSYDKNPKLDSIICEVEFSDSQVKEYLFSMIVENSLTVLT